MRVGELIEQAGVNIETVRLYERNGLLPPPPRRPSGYRIYDESSLRRLRFIKRAQELASVEWVTEGWAAGLVAAASAPEVPEIVQ